MDNYISKDAYKLVTESEDCLNKAVKIEDGNILINVEFEYAISLDDCGSYEKILAWTHHLSGKTWMKLEVIERFICRSLNLI